MLMHRFRVTGFSSKKGRVLLKNKIIIFHHENAFVRTIFWRYIKRSQTEMVWTPRRDSKHNDRRILKMELQSERARGRPMARYMDIKRLEL